MIKMVKLVDLARTIRSKNAGSYRLTFEIIFDDYQTYDRVRLTGVLSAGLISRLYHIPPEDVTHFVEFDPGNAIKATIRRPTVSGDLDDSDVFGCQQQVPLFDVEIPWE
jgi:hypothetical protein